MMSSESRRAISVGLKLTSVVVLEGVNESRSSRTKGGGFVRSSVRGSRCYSRNILLNTSLEDGHGGS